MDTFKSIVFFFTGFLLCACAKPEKGILIEITNDLNLNREFETVEVTSAFVGLQNLDNYSVINYTTKDTIPSQLIDSDGNGTMDVILFQPKISANNTQLYSLVLRSNTQHITENRCYSRFVPERTDDYAWENNRVAFRTYGPNAQYRYENKLKEGTLSSGVDAWLKRVEYSIIDNWYKKYTEKTGTYHEDTGEGLDNFHVGSSRGVGGIAYKKDSTYYTSKNFITYKTLTTGPIRTSFVLDYGTWAADTIKIKESKTITLDYGSNLSKFEIELHGINAISAGLTLHENDGTVTAQKNNSWLSYWQPHADTELGTAIVTTPKYYVDSETYLSNTKDLSNAYMHLKVLNNKTVYFAGFTWLKSNQFKNQKAWEAYLTDFAVKLRTPLKLKHLKNL